MNDLPSFEEFRTQALAQGCYEVLERVWEPNLVLADHRHPFNVIALVVKGEMWLNCESGERHLLPGDRFELRANVMHAERYGPQGTTFWAGRSH